MAVFAMGGVVSSAGRSAWVAIWVVLALAVVVGAVRWYQHAQDSKRHWDEVLSQQAYAPGRVDQGQGDVADVGAVLRRVRSSPRYFVGDLIAELADLKTSMRDEVGSYSSRAAQGDASGYQHYAQGRIDQGQRDVADVGAFLRRVRSSGRYLTGELITQLEDLETAMRDEVGSYFSQTEEGAASGYHCYEDAISPRPDFRS